MPYLEVSCRILLLGLLTLLPDAAKAQRIDYSARAKRCTDNEVVVALQQGGPGVLRAMNYRSGAWTERVISNVPVRIESIDIGRIHSNINSVVAGLERNYVGSSGAIRVYTYNSSAAAWGEQGLGQGINNNVEAIAAHDIDGDGRAEIIAGLEGPFIESRLRVYRYNQGWSEEVLTPLSYQHDIQYVSAVDLFGDGQKWVLALVGDWAVAPSYMELRAYRRTAAGWESRLIASNVGNFPRAERFIAANIDTDPETEILIGMWNGYSYADGGLFLLDYDGQAWQAVPMNLGLGVIDAMGIGRFSNSSSRDVIIGTWREVLLYSQGPGGWAPTPLIPAIGAFMTWDADFGHVRELGDIALAALDQRLHMLRWINGGVQNTLIRTMPSRIDSVQVGDIDGIADPCVLHSSVDVLSAVLPDADPYPVITAGTNPISALPSLSKEYVPIRP